MVKMTGLNSNGVSKERIALIFQKIMDNNNLLKNDFVSALEYLKVLKNKDNVDSKAMSTIANNAGPFSSLIKDKFDLVQTYDTLRVQIDIIIPEIEKIIDSLDNEKKELKKKFDSIHFEEIMSLKSFEKLAIEFNSNQRDLIQNVLSKVPGLEKVASNVLGIQEKIIMDNHQIFVQSARNFMKFFVEFYSLLLTGDKNNKEALFNAFVSAVKYLEFYKRESSGIIQDFGEGFITAVRSLSLSNSQLTSINKNLDGKGQELRDVSVTFLQHFFGANVSKGNVVLQTLHSFDIKEATLSKTYSELNKYEKLDDKFRSMLLLLFEGIEIELDGETKKAKDVIEKIIPKKSNISDLKEEIVSLIKQINIILENDDSIEYKRNKGIDHINIKLSNGNLITFEEIKKDFCKDSNKEELEFLITSLEKIILASSEKDIKKKIMYEKFLELNLGGLKALKKRENKKNNAESDSSTISPEDKSKIKDSLQVILGIFDIDEISEEIKTDVINAFSDLLSLLFGGKLGEVIKIDSGKYICSRFISVCNSFGKKTHDLQIQEVLSYAYANSQNLEKYDIETWKTFSDLLRFLNS
jgi:hypothetical protein